MSKSQRVKAYRKKHKQKGLCLSCNQPIYKGGRCLQHSEAQSYKYYRIKLPFMPPPSPSPFRPYPRNPYGASATHLVSGKISEADYQYLKSLFPATSGLSDCTISNLLHSYVAALRAANFSSSFPVFSSDHPLAPLIPALLRGAFGSPPPTQASPSNVGGGTSGICEKHGKQETSSLPPSPKEEPTKGKETLLPKEKNLPIHQPTSRPSRNGKDAPTLGSLLASLKDYGVSLDGISD